MAECWYLDSGLRTVVLNQKDNMPPCLGTRAILKYINSQEHEGRFVVLILDEGFESHSVFQYGNKEFGSIDIKHR